MQCYQKLIENLENRIGKHSGRISNINQLIDLYGKEIWQVTCPRILRDNTIHDFANCFYGPWTVGKIYNIKGKDQ